MEQLNGEQVQQSPVRNRYIYIYKYTQEVFIWKLKTEYHETACEFGIKVCIYTRHKN